MDSARAEIVETLPDGIEVLNVDDIGSLRIPWDGRFSSSDLRDLLRGHSSIAVWKPRTGEYVVGGAWRHRAEIATILELSATGGAVDLIQALAIHARARGNRLLVVSEQAERRKREFYVAAGMDEIEEIVIYELTRFRARPPRLSGLRFERLDITNRTMLDEILELDHAAFPWVWWNSEDEFRQYHDSPGVAIDVARQADGRMVAYVGTTRFRTWGHLDRIAVSPDLQGAGLGRAALDYAVMTLAASGARRIGLSTQARNTRSRALYESYGFHRSPSHDYRIYGRWLEPAAAVRA